MSAESRPLPCHLPNARCKIIGAGVIGLSLALELRLRGAQVTVLDRGPAMAQASTAAAGMLAVEDPFNPPELLPLSRLSGALYPDFLARLEELSGLRVPFQTDITLQTMPTGEVRELPEHSLDPRQLAAALRLAAERAGVHLLEHHRAQLSPERDFEIEVHTAGAWQAPSLPAAFGITPRKGQMLRVRIPAGLALWKVHRREHGYVVPRTEGPQAGTALLGATVEDAGFDTGTSPESLRSLRLSVAELVPELADTVRAPMLEAWAGLRPTTPDLLPLLGEVGELDPASRHANCRTFVATGHFRNGILLAPATASVMADLLEGRPPRVDLSAFFPARFAATSPLAPTAP